MILTYGTPVVAAELPKSPDLADAMPLFSAVFRHQPKNEECHLKEMEYHWNDAIQAVAFLLRCNMVLLRAAQDGRVDYTP